MKFPLNKIRKTPVAMALTLALLPLSQAVYADFDYPDRFNEIYAGSETVNNGGAPEFGFFGCKTCHEDGFPGGDVLNPFGVALCNLGLLEDDLVASIQGRLQAIEGLDSDGDGSTNLDEILASTQPGWTLGNGNSTFDSSDCTSLGNDVTAPADVAGELDLLLAENSIPVAIDDTATTGADTSVTIDVLANDIDDDGEDLSVDTVTENGATKGTVFNNGTDVTFTPDADFCGIAKFKYTATDGTDVSADAIVTVNVGDQDAPVITVPEDLIIPLSAGVIQISADDPQIVAFLAAATANDEQDGVVVVDNNAPENFGLGTTPVVFSAVDSCANEEETVVNVTIEAADNNAPDVTTPDPNPLEVTAALCAVSIAQDNPEITAWLASSTANDLEDGDLDVVNNAPAEFPLGDTTVTFSATDSLDTVGSVDGTLTVLETLNTNPTIEAPGNIAIQVDAGIDSVDSSTPKILEFLAAAIGFDQEDGDLVVSNDASENFGLGTTTVTFTVTDACGLTATAQATVTINFADGGEANNPPTIVASDSITIDAELCSTSVLASDEQIELYLAGATADDIEDGDLTDAISNDAPEEFQAGVETTVTFSVSDSGEPIGISLTSSDSSTVTVVDINTAPIIEAPGALNIVISAPEDGGFGFIDLSKNNVDIAAFLASAIANDPEDGVLNVLNDSPDFFKLGATTITFTATDACGLTNTVTSTITIELDVIDGEEEEEEEVDDNVVLISDRTEYKRRDKIKIFFSGSTSNRDRIAIFSADGLNTSCAKDGKKFASKRARRESGRVKFRRRLRPGDYVAQMLDAQNCHLGEPVAFTVIKRRFRFWWW